MTAPNARVSCRDVSVSIMFDADAAEFLSFPDLLKATPHEEGGDRFVYIEASNETRDFHGEKVLAKALAESAPYYQQYGNLDLDHVSVVGARRGIPNPYLYEIGNPVEVVAGGDRTFVKGAIFKGDTDVAAHANAFWDSITKLNPAKRWYPSVGGAVIGRAVQIDPVTERPTPVITAVRWSNIGFSATPVNPAVPGVSTVPFGLLAKSFSASGEMAIALKGLTATPGGPDMASLTGGAALREQSLDRSIQSLLGTSATRCRTT